MRSPFSSDATARRTVRPSLSRVSTWVHTLAFLEALTMVTKINHELGLERREGESNP